MKQKNPIKHGPLFGENIWTGKIKRRRYEEDPPELRMRTLFLPIVLGIIFFILLFKLFSLQIIHGDYYKKLANSNRIRTQIIHAPRGVIFDRNGVPLVLNVPGFRETIRDKNGKIQSTKIISKEDALAMIAKGAQNIEVDSLRQYPFKNVYAHVLGYIGQISQDEIQTPEYANYLANDWIGKSGIERQYEHDLKGIDGQQLLEVDAQGQIMRSLGQTDPIPGADITLTLDSKIQQKAYDAAKDIQKGAVVVSKPDGEILAMVSKPAYDPNLFTMGDHYSVATDAAYTSLQAVLSDTSNQPLLDRAIAGTYPPGSTFKIVTAAAGLQDKIIDQNYRIADTGIVKVGDFSFANWYYTEYGKTEQGELNVVRALARSNDIFFYKLAEKVGVDRISAMANQMGAGNVLGIDLGGEASGLVPTKEWKKKQLHQDWYLGDTYHYGIGQGDLLTTPLQVNSWTQVVANGGMLYQPRLDKNSQAKVERSNILSEKTIDLIRQGMIQACSTGGVAYPLFNYKVKNADLKIDNKNFTSVASASADMRHVAVACKTGTAEHGGADTKPHAWITLFAPAYDPQIVVTVLSESSGEGSVVAAPVAKKILDAYFSK